MYGEKYGKCIICGKEFKYTRMRTCTCSNECAQKRVNRWKAEREKRMYPEIECENSIPDEKEPKLFRCKETGYLCSPKERKPHERFHCLFEPQYMKNKRVQRTLKIIKTIEPGMMVSYLIRTKGDGYLKYKTSGLTMKIKEIFPDGRIILEAMIDREKYSNIRPRTEWRSIHDFYDVLHVDEETFKEAMQKALLELLYHVPNGGSRDRREAANLKAQGVKAGVPDLFLPVAKSGKYGLYIEMKWGKNKTTEKQDWWIKQLREQGYAVEICRGADEAMDVIAAYMGIREETGRMEDENIREV